MERHEIIKLLGQLKLAVDRLTHHCDRMKETSGPNMRKRPWIIMMRTYCMMVPAPSMRSRTRQARWSIKSGSRIPSLDHAGFSPADGDIAGISTQPPPMRAADYPEQEAE